jgi:uncharacterized protein YecE (DUF72 family)
MHTHSPGRLTAVEINNTFYRLPNAKVLTGWAEQTPESLRFAIKASRRITHIKRLKDAEDETAYLIDTVRIMGERLGVLFFQTPPNLKKDIQRLHAFLDLMPGDIPVAFEFRHETWLEPDVIDELRGRGAALCLADTEESPIEDLTVTAPFGYVRLRKPAYSDAQLKSWAAKMKGAGWEKVFVFFKHEEDASGPLMAEKFIGLLG